MKRERERREFQFRKKEKKESTRRCVCTRTDLFLSSRTKTKTTTTATSPSSSCRARSALSGTDLAAWDSASSLVAEQLQIAGSEADDLLEVAFGWGKSTYWRGSVDEAMPDAAAVSSSIAFLRDDLGMTVDEVLAVLRSFPETLNLSAEDQLKKNVEKLAKDWKIQGPAAKGCVKRTPRLLGYTVDCAGDCIGLCDRCWVRF